MVIVSRMPLKDVGTCRGLQIRGDKHCHRIVNPMGHDKRASTNNLKHMKKILATMLASAMTLSATACGHQPKQAPEENTNKTEAQLPKVYFIKEINSANLLKIYEALGRKAEGKVAVKLSTGEPGNNNHLDPNLIKDLVQRVNGTIVECNTAYGGGRSNTQSHLKAAADHGFTAIAKVDIMDADGDVALPIKNGKHLKADYVGKHYLDYDFTMVLSHFKGHPMAGFGGALKNISIGIASADGKGYIHSAGRVKSAAKAWNPLPKQDDFLESMAEACQAIINHAGDKILYISVANNLSVDCDCVATPEEVKMKDIGILASLDPVALDRACVGMVRQSDDPDKSHLIERIDSRHGTHILDYAEQLGLGSQQYELVELK